MLVAPVGIDDYYEGLTWIEVRPRNGRDGLGILEGGRPVAGNMSKGRGFHPMERMDYLRITRSLTATDKSMRCSTGNGRNYCRQQHQQHLQHGLLHQHHEQLHRPNISTQLNTNFPAQRQLPPHLMRLATKIRATDFRL